MRITRLTRVAIAAASLSFAQAALATPTFTGSESFGTDTATYSITTDGTIGALDASDITSWTMTFNNGSTTFTMGSATGGYLDFWPLGSGLSSTGTNLLYDFGTMGSQNPTAYALFWDSPSNNAYFCFQANGCFSNSGGAVAMDWMGVQDVNSLRGVQVVASLAGSQGAVPEPATWAMMLVGFGAVGAAARRKKRVGRAALV